MAGRGPTGKSSFIEIEKVSFVEYFHGENRELNVFRLPKLLSSMVGLTNWKVFPAIYCDSISLHSFCVWGGLEVFVRKIKIAGQILQPFQCCSWPDCCQESCGNGKAAFQYFHFCLTWGFCWLPLQRVFCANIPSFVSGNVTCDSAVPLMAVSSVLCVG